MTDIASKSSSPIRQEESQLVRYLVDSTAEFGEIIATLNQIVGHAGSKEEMIKLQQAVLFSAIPLPNHLSKFIACFSVSVALLERVPNNPQIILDLLNVRLDRDRFKCTLVQEGLIARYLVDTLWDLNLAFGHFNRGLTTCLNGMEAVRTKRLMVTKIQPRKTKDESNQLHISVHPASLNITSTLKESLEEACSLRIQSI